MYQDFFDSVRDTLGADAVDTTEARGYGVHSLPGRDRTPAGALYPGSTKDVQEMVLLAAQHGVSLWPFSTGQNIGIGGTAPVRDGQVIMHLGRRMNQILEINETLGYAVLEPGVTYQQLRAELARLGDNLMLSTISGPSEASIVGNALDRGAGYTPYFDHFGMTCGMEVVLGDGSVLRTNDGALASARGWHVNKYGFGPHLDGIFTQSNYGIVTRLGVWLMPRPPVARTFFFSYPDDGDLGEIIDLIRPLKMANVVPTLIKAVSDLYSLTPTMTYPFERTNGAVPLPNDVRSELQREFRLGAWTATGALYGATEAAIEPTLRRVRDHFENSGNATYISHEEALDNPALKINIDTFTGEPTNEEMPIHDWRPGGGSIWFVPSTPMLGETANELQALSRKILAQHGFDYVVEYVCGPRTSRALHCISFNRAEPDERLRVHRCFESLIAQYDVAGYPIGRTPVDFQEAAMQRLPELKRVCDALKSALDPEGAIAPGKYGIE